MFQCQNQDISRGEQKLRQPADPTSAEIEAARSQPQPPVRRSKRGVRYASNPFLPDAATNTRQGIKRITNKDGNRMMVVSEGTGEIVAPAGFWHTQEVDKTQFVKLYINGVKALTDLTSAGTKVFGILYREVQGGVGKDELWLTFPSIDQKITPMAHATFYRGMKELLEKGFIAESEVPGRYFLNPDFMWNGDRLAFVKEYKKLSEEPVAIPKNSIDSEINRASTEQEQLEARGQLRLMD
jgi:hypothetical protein